MPPNKSEAGTGPATPMAAFLDGRVSVRTALVMFWASFAGFLFTVTFLPKDWIDSRWFTAGWKIVINLSIAFWVAADARAHQFEEDRARSYAVFAAVIPEFTVPIYLVRSRGVAGAAKACLRFFGYLLSVFAVVFTVAAAAKLAGIPVSF